MYPVRCKYIVAQNDRILSENNWICEPLRMVRVAWLPMWGSRNPMNGQNRLAAHVGIAKPLRMVRVA